VAVLERLIDFEGDVLGFMTSACVPLTTNTAEIRFVSEVVINMP